MPTNYYFEETNDDDIATGLFGRKVTRSEEEGITWCHVVTNFETAATHGAY